uniref:Uncharacterized protein n=1 Tax=Anopheles atroparvus TaxID=41427 RepID=A0A182JMR4_ANOAO
MVVVVVVVVMVLVVMVSRRCLRLRMDERLRTKLYIFSQFQKDERELRTLPLSLVVVLLLVDELAFPDAGCCCCGCEVAVSAPCPPEPSEVLEACRSTLPPALGLRSRTAGAGAAGLPAKVADWPLPMLALGASFRKDCFRERLSQFFTLVVSVSRLGRGNGDELTTPPPWKAAEGGIGGGGSAIMEQPGACGLFQSLLQYLKREYGAVRAGRFRDFRVIGATNRPTDRPTAEAAAWCRCSSTMFVSSRMAAIFFESSERTFGSRGEPSSASRRPSPPPAPVPAVAPSPTPSGSSCGDALELLTVGHLQLLLQVAHGQRERLELVVHLGLPHPAGERFRLVRGQLVQQAIALGAQNLYIVIHRAGRGAATSGHCHSRGGRLLPASPAGRQQQLSTTVLKSERKVERKPIVAGACGFLTETNTYDVTQQRAYVGCETLDGDEERGKQHHWHHQRRRRQEPADGGSHEKTQHHRDEAEAEEDDAARTMVVSLQERAWCSRPKRLSSAAVCAQRRRRGRPLVRLAGTTSDTRGRQNARARKNPDTPHDTEKYRNRSRDQESGLRNWSVTAPAEKERRPSHRSSSRTRGCSLGRFAFALPRIGGTTERRRREYTHEVTVRSSVTMHNHQEQRQVAGTEACMVMHETKKLTQTPGTPSVVTW